jgi:hypothetical protein
MEPRYHAALDSIRGGRAVAADARTTTVVLAIAIGDQFLRRMQQHFSARTK